MRRVWRVPPAVWPCVLAGLLSGAAGGLLFAAAHAVIIVPIWSRMATGIVFGAIAGAAAGWALFEYRPGYAASSARIAAGFGARLGGILWLLVTPVTAADALLRATELAPRFELLAVGVALVLAVGGGAVFGWYRTKRRRGAISWAVATLMLTVSMAGPVPVGRSLRALSIFLAVLPIAVLAGSVLALGARQLSLLQARRTKAPPPVPADQRDT